MDWRHLSVQELAREYSPSSCIGGNYQPHIQDYLDRSEKAYSETVTLGARWLTLRYGPSPSHSIDLCLPSSTSRAPAGLLVFIHGGYWQELSAKYSLFAAKACLQNGVAFAAVDYTLAPKATVDQIVQECRAALAHLAKQADTLGLDRSQFVVAGSSAGAHLVAMCALDNEISLHAAVLVSGIYELEPLVSTSINQALGMDSTAAKALSPQLISLRSFPKSIVCFGEIETDAFKDQSHTFAQKLTANGTSCDCFEIASRNHFDVIVDLAIPESQLSQKTFALFQPK